jgi:hypothetical protein
MARSVPLSRFTSRVGGGSAFFVRHREHENVASHFVCSCSGEFALRLRHHRADFIQLFVGLVIEATAVEHLGPVVDTRITAWVVWLMVGWSLRIEIR